MKGYSYPGTSPLHQDEEIYATAEERKEFKPNKKTGEIVSRNKPYTGYTKIKGTNIWKPPTKEEEQEWNPTLSAEETKLIERDNPDMYN